MPRRDDGRLHVVAGPMFAGKTEELVRRLRRAQLAGRSVEVYNHSFDVRGGSADLVSHSGLSIAARPAPDVDSLRALLAEHHPDVVGIDEAQFFGPALCRTVEDLVRSGATVEVAGLCVTYDGGPFDPVPALMAVAEEAVKLTAVCAVCGADAVFHQRLVAGPGGDARVPVAAHVGGAETYQARCRRHFEPGPA